MIEREGEHCTYLLFPSLAAIPGLIHGVFTRLGGFSTTPYAGLNLVITTGDDPDRVARNRESAARALGFTHVFAVKPVHGAETVIMRRAEVDALRAAQPTTWPDALRARLRRHNADAMITDAPDLPLLWAYGDCAPILLYDPAHQAIALVHAGWRGTAQAILPRTLDTMRATFGTRVEDVRAAIGPAIGACCYEVTDEVIDAFAREPRARAALAHEERRVTTTRGTTRTAHYIDIAASNERQLLAAGILPAHLETSGICTGCRTDLFYSNRKEPKPSGRFGVAFSLTARASLPQADDGWQPEAVGGAA